MYLSQQPCSFLVTIEKSNTPATKTIYKKYMNRSKASVYNSMIVLYESYPISTICVNYFRDI